MVSVVYENDALLLCIVIIKGDFGRWGVLRMDIFHSSEEACTRRRTPDVVYTA